MWAYWRRVSPPYGAGVVDFAEALTKAVDNSGLSLERIQHHLAARGMQVSLSTLSYWRRGRSRPERPESLKVVTALEELLDLGEGFLTDRLGDKRPRGRWVGQAMSLEDMWDSRATDLGEVMARIDRAPAASTYLSVRDRQVIGPDRREVEMHCTGIVQALDDGVDRFLAIQLADPADLGVPSIETGAPCRLGRVRGEDATGFLVAEILFDRMLRAGETALVDYRVRMRPGADSEVCDRRFLRPVGEYVLQIDFHPDAVPARCYAFTRPSLQEPETALNDLWIGTTASTHIHVRNSKPGIYGVRWEWD
ncbi:hypothetical protein C8D88_109352 [Lentzea atacamensis]|uniref:Uncharacterized protein n=1 Tax=Lentzea atacamensis TaxID=531938 RepID=A0A316I1H9_9PSEU|nr:hypothetical protein C8D88_109352 [Lentzea atacamensis]RAS69135.1 hypothetical protein C8D87_1021213 [Lentzea atacamensis]